MKIESVYNGETTTAPPEASVRDAYMVAPDPGFTYTFVKWVLNGEDFDYENTPITQPTVIRAVYDYHSS